jgi:DNA-binding LytR/AlgR family response regulator
MTMSPLPLQVLIVEDDPLFSVELQMLVEELGYEVLDTVDNSGEALELIIGSSPDLILMDIDIKGRLNGLQIGKKIQHLRIPILYITSFDDPSHHSQASEAHMIGYLVKPLSKYSIQSAIKLAVQSLAAQAQQQPQPEAPFVLDRYFFFRKRQVYQKVAIEEICLIEADRDYIQVVVASGENFSARVSISQMEAQLPAHLFFRSHRSYIINLNQIEAINFRDNLVEMASHQVPISKAKRKELMLLVNKID